MLSWEFDASEPLISPDRTLAYYRELLGDSSGELVLPDLLVGTFQQMAFEHLAGSIDGEPPVRWPTPAFWPLAKGSHRGRSLAVIRLPVGAPAAAFALELAIAAGARTILLAGSAGSLQPHLHLGSLVVPTRALRHEGTSHHYLLPNQPATSSPDLVDALVSAALQRGMEAPTLGLTWTTDAVYRECAETVARLGAEGVLVVEMEAAGLFAVARHRGVRLALVVAVSDELRQRWSPGFHTLAYRRALLAAAGLALDAATR